MICTRCGRAAADGTRFCMYCGSQLLPAYPPAQPVFGYGMPPLPSAAAPKKKKVWPWILAVSLTVFVVLCVIFAVFLGRLLQGFHGDTVVTVPAESYIDAVTELDGDGLAACLPPEYLSYLAESFSMDDTEDLAACLTNYLWGQDMQDGDSPYAWMETHGYLTVEDGDSLTIQAAEAALSQADLTMSDCKTIWEDGEKRLTMVQIDDTWYVLEAMQLTTHLCLLTCGEDSSFALMSADYWDSMYVEKSPDLENRIPQPFWDYLSQERNTDTTQAQQAMADYLDWVEAYYDVGRIQKVTFDYDPTEVDWYTEGSSYRLSDFGMEFTMWADVYMDMDIVGEKGSVSDSSYLTIVEYEDKWYVYDYMYFCEIAVTGDYAAEDGYDFGYDFDVDDYDGYDGYDFGWEGNGIEDLRMYAKTGGLL